MTKTHRINEVAIVPGDGYPWHLEIKSAIIDTAVVGPTTIVAAVPGRCIRVTAIKFSAAGDVTTQWSSDSTPLGPAETFKAGGGMSDNWFPGYFFKTAEGEALKLTLSGVVQVSGWINYLEE